MKNILSELNDAQREAVVNANGPNLIIAGAGSGKTRVLTYRIAYLLQSGVFAGNIMALTFTNKAASEMKERIIKLVGFEAARYLWMGTFHSLFGKILRAEADKLKFSSNFSIYDTDDSKSLIKSILKELLLDDKIYKPNEVHNRISSAKNNLVTAESYLNNPVIYEQDLKNKNPEIGKIYRIYQNRLRTADAMDFDDLLLNVNILFRDNKETLEKYQQHFKYILVDEYQDTNFAQYLVINKLSALHKNISVVGDDSQSIYSFRGAKIENILNFKNDYPNYKLFKLEQNYRSTKVIVEAANSLINNNKNRIPKKVFSDNEEGNKIKLVRAFTDNEEGFIVADLLKNFKNENNFSYKDFAILYRINSQSRIFEESLRRNAIPYKVYGGLSFYQRKEVKDVIAYLRLSVNNNDNEALKRVYNFPARGIGKTTFEKIEKIAVTNNTSLWKVISQLENINTGLSVNTTKKIIEFKNLIENISSKIKDTDAFELVNYVIQQSKIIQELKAEKTQESITRIQNIEELINGVKDFCDTEKLENEGTIVTIEKYLENVSLLTDFDTADDKEQIDRVSLMTVHSAKGLEFNCVFIVGVEHQLFPMYFNGYATQEDIEEERRLFYVAITRAKKIATITYAENRYKWGKPTICQPSNFIKEIDENYLEISNNTINDNTFETYSKPKFQNKINLIDIKPKKLLNLSSAKNCINENNIITLTVGDTILHNRFGKGKVIQIEGEPPNSKALIDFELSGSKQLLLKFAKFKIL